VDFFLRFLAILVILPDSFFALSLTLPREGGENPFSPSLYGRGQGEGELAVK